MIEKFSVVIVEDARLELKGTEEIFRTEIPEAQIIGVASNEKELDDLLKADVPDLLLLDLGLGGSTTVGVEICTRVKKDFPQMKVLVFTGELLNEKLWVDVLDAGAEDLIVEDGVAEIWGEPAAFEAIANALEAAGITASEAAVTRRPDNTVSITDVHTAEQILKLIDKLEDLDDVQEVTGNFEIDDSIADQVNV